MASGEEAASDSDENAAREIGFFFPESDLAALWG